MILRFAFEKLFKAHEAANRKRQERARPGADEGFDPYEKPFLEHLEDLRKSLGKMLVFTVVVTMFAFIFNLKIFEFVQLPAKLAKFEDGSTLHEKISFLTLKPQEILMLSIKTSFFAGLIFSFPFLVWFAGEFIMPGLRQAEKRYIVPGVGVGFVLFLVGASFAFFLAAPIALKFFYNFSVQRFGLMTPKLEQQVARYEPVQLLPVEAEKPAAPEKPGGDTAPDSADTPKKPAAEIDPATKEAVRGYLQDLLVVPRGSQISLYYDQARDKIVISSQPMKAVSYQIGEYINFITRLTLVFGISFELPVVVVILVKLELLTARVMRRTRSYAWVVILIAAAILTPPDVLTLSLLGGPLIVLYEICVWIAWFMERGREKERLAEERAREERLARLYSKSHDELSEDEKRELNQHEIEQYEREHTDLYEDESTHLIEHDPHADPHHDEHGHPYDPDHDEGWHDEYDPGHDPFHHDYHEGETEHQPVQDWPDRGHGETESDHVAGKDTGEPDGVQDGEEVCEPDGPVVNLNSATEEELLTLPGIGPAMARRLMEHRPYRSFDDVSGVPGIGDARLYAMIERLSIDEVEEDGEAEEEEPFRPGPYEEDEGSADGDSKS